MTCAVSDQQPMKKRKNKDREVVMLSVWVPSDMFVRIDEVARAQDLDRSKLVRRAIRQQLEANS